MFLVVNQRSRGEGRILRENVRFPNVKIMLFENWRISECVEELTVETVISKWI